MGRKDLLFLFVIEMPVHFVRRRAHTEWGGCWKLHLFCRTCSCIVLVHLPEGCVADIYSLWFWWNRLFFLKCFLSSSSSTSFVLSSFVLFKEYELESWRAQRTIDLPLSPSTKPKKKLAQKNKQWQQQRGNNKTAIGVMCVVPGKVLLMEGQEKWMFDDWSLQSWYGVLEKDEKIKKSALFPLHLQRQSLACFFFVFWMSAVKSRGSDASTNGKVKKKTHGSGTQLFGNEGDQFRFLPGFQGVSLQQSGAQDEFRSYNLNLVPVTKRDTKKEKKGGYVWRGKKVKRGGGRVSKSV